MDLLQTVRKEGSRGGRAEFSWDNVKTDAQRENYLGHSLMAPVGRWQKNKDLTWYAKDSKGNQLSEADSRKEEIRRVKEAEAVALAKALGIDVPAGAVDNPNMTELGTNKEVQKAIKESMDDEEDSGAGRGIGFGGFGAQGAAGGDREIMAGTRPVMDESSRRHEKVTMRREERSQTKTHGEERHRRRRSRSRDGHRQSRRKRSAERSRRHRSRSRSRSRDPHREKSREHRRPRDSHGGYDRSRETRDSPERHRRHRDRSLSPRRTYHDSRQDRG